MGYFPNGSAGMDYEAKFCEKCVHYGPKDGPGCPVFLLHLLWNYDAVGKSRSKIKEEALNSFIQRTKDGLGNEKCRMFVPMEYLTKEGKEEITLPDRQAGDKLKLKEWERLYGKPDAGIPADLDFGIGGKGNG
jgi:hypothetical protein